MQCTHNRSLMQIRRDWEHKRGRARRNNGNQPWTSESISECHSVIGWHSHCITLNSIDNTCRPLPPLAFISLMYRVAHRYKCYNPNENDSALTPSATDPSRCRINRYTLHVIYNNRIISVFNGFINVSTRFRKPYIFLPRFLPHLFFFVIGLREKYFFSESSCNWIILN